LAGAARQIASWQAELAESAASSERRRIARDLHDGLAQELAFISTQSRWLAQGVGGEDRLEQLALAAARALDESRSAIAALTRPLDEPLEVARVRDVTADGQRAEPLGLALERVAPAREHRDVRAFGGQRLGRSETEARRRAEDDCRTAFQSEVHQSRDTTAGGLSSSDHLHRPAQTSWTDLV
jgi:Histidine kinase